MSMIHLEGKSTLVTGAGGAIGGAVALAFARSGGAVACADLNEEAAAKVAGQIRAEGGRAVAIRLDIGQPGAADEAVATTIETFGRLDVLANIAGAGGAGHTLLEQTQEFWDRMLLINLTGTMWMCRAALPQMIRQGRGSIINTTSVAGLVGTAGSTAYSAAKAGLLGFTKALAKEEACHRINVNAVAPGLIDTPMSRARGSTDHPERMVIWPRIGLPEDCAGLYLYLASDAAEFVTGQVVSPNGGGVM
jgi:NAD(P)-dependent dehydrogenase (short-subunit alcohol dehydrogenase family)